MDAELKRLAERQPGGSDAWAGTEGPSRRLACAAPQRQAFGACHVVALYALVGLEGVGSLVAELRRHAVRAFTVRVRAGGPQRRRKQMHTVWVRGQRRSMCSMASAVCVGPPVLRGAAP